MLLPAIIAIATANQKVPYNIVLKTEAKSPHLEQATLIQDRRKAYEFMLLVQDRSPKPWKIMKLNWRRSNVLAIYPGLVQRDATVTLKGIIRNGGHIKVTLDSRPGISAQTYYPILIVMIPKQPPKVPTQVRDLGK